MLQVIYGLKGSGKTKRILDMANEAVKTAAGDLVFIDDDNRYMFDLRHEVRFINASDYSVSSPDMFLGFILGIIASNYDMSVLFIDGFLRLVKANLEDLEELFRRVERISDEHNVQVIISCTGDPAEMPEFLQKFII